VLTVGLSTRPHISLSIQSTTTVAWHPGSEDLRGDPRASRRDLCRMLHTTEFGEHPFHDIE
jgi:hypothetical protein